VLGPEWAITPAEAFACYTRGSAYLSFDEHRRGSLEPGKLADFVILGADPLRVPPDEIKDIVVVETVVGGRTDYRGDGL
jgi:predicted amidohydrolase YtcJ